MRCVSTNLSTLVRLPIPARFSSLLCDLAAALGGESVGSGDSAFAPALAASGDCARRSKVLSAVRQLSTDGLLDYAEGVCSEVFVFALTHAVIMPRIQGGLLEG
jgi:hypothetical protein